MRDVVTRRIASTQSIALGAAWVTALIAPAVYGRRDQRGDPCGAERNRLCRRDAAGDNVPHVSSPFLRKQQSQQSEAPELCTSDDQVAKKINDEGAEARPGPSGCRDAARVSCPCSHPVRTQ